MASPMPYATYQGHRRGQSTSSSGTLNNRAGTAIGSSNGIGGAGSPNSTLQRPTISISKVATMNTHDAVPPITPASPLRAGQVRSMSSNGGPPPLRTISSLRSAAAAAASTSSPPALRTAKGKESSVGSDKVDVSNVSPSTSSSSSAGLDLSRRTVSSSLAIPTDNNGSSSTSSLSISQNDSPSLRSNGHFKRHSYSYSNNATASLHARSASSSNTILPNFPQHMSTAQRLRSSNQSSNTPTGSSSNASSPTATPRGLSPSLEAMMGSGLTYQQVQSMTNFDSDTIGRRTTYRPGFQPKGMYRVRTDEFTAARERRREGKSGSSSVKAGEETKARKELESQRLERRLEKLLALHYESTPVSLDSIPSWLPNTLRKTRQMAEEERRIRDEEMRIVKWEEDSTRKICPICQTPFSLSVRKHHCRLCGRIVCASPQLSLPPGFDGSSNNNNSNDSGKVEEMKCSSLMVADGKGGTIIKDMPKWEDRNGIKEVAEGGRRGIRICRDCRETIMHRQYMLDDGSVPAYLRLYEALITLQKEIEQSLPEFTEMVLGLQKQDAAAALGTTGVGGAGAEAVEDILSPTRIDASASAASSLAAIKAKNKNSLALQRDAAQARKQLLANFANYDLIAKKIRNIDDEGNASLARIKGAIWTKANLFLQQNMFPLQSLPKLSTKKEKEKRKTGSGTNTPTSDNGDKGSTKDPIVLPFRSMLGDEASGGGNRRMDVNADARAVELVQKDPGAAKESLVVLEQQLKLVREYAASASKARKFQDAKSLKASAQDLEAEILRLKRLGVTTS